MSNNKSVKINRGDDGYFYVHSRQGSSTFKCDSRFTNYEAASARAKTILTGEQETNNEALKLKALLIRALRALHDDDFPQLRDEIRLAIGDA